MYLLQHFQKGSPILEEANEIIGIAQAMGMIEPKIASSLPNATKCTNLLDIEKSQKKDEILLIFDQIKGMLMFWGLGMVLASIVFVAENAMRPIRKEKIRSKFTGVIQNCMQVMREKFISQKTKSIEPTSVDLM